MLNPGDPIDIWVVEKALGSGGMGSVYRCHNRTATRILAAVKVLDSHLRKVPGAEERFIREAEILFQLDHPNIVKVRNIRTDTDPPYLEMEFVEGGSLEGLLEQGPVRIDKAVPLMIELADAVDYLHGKGIRHRDIKPANLLIKNDGRVKLVDFGLAMEADVTRITQTGVTFGTVSYAPPEWVTPERLDPVRWDIYAMGVVFWEMLTGQVAFPVSGQGSARQQAMQVILAKQHHPPLDPGPQFEDGLREIVRAMTHSHAEERPQSAGEVRDRLQGLTREIRPLPAGAAPVERARTGETWVEGGTPAPAASARASQAGSQGLAGAVAPHATPAAATPEVTLETRKPTPSASSSPLKGPSSVETLHPTTLDPEPRRSRLPLVLGLLGAGVVGLGAVAAVAIAGIAFLSGGGPPPRDVDVVVSGLPNGTPVSLSVAGQPPAGQDAWIFHFRGVPVGGTAVKAAVGPDCAPCLDPTASCPSWCGVTAVDEDVQAGESAQIVPLALEPPAPRPVRIAAPKVEGLDVTLTVGDSAFLFDQGAATLELPPGRHRAEAKAGEAVWSGDLEVPWGQGEHAIELPLTAAAKEPTKAEKAPKAASGTTKAGGTTKPPKDAASGGTTAAAATTAAASSGTGTGTAGAAARPVTNGDFAKFLAKNADWQRDAAIGAGRADGSYLSGWTDASPPAGAEGQAAVNVSWYAAAAYCTSRGGLAPVEAEPLTWAESGSQPGIEWRTDGGRAAWRSSDGMSSTAVQKASGNALTGFRCAR